MSITLRPAREADFPRIWPIFESIVRKGDTYTYDAATDERQARRIWMELPNETWVAEEAGRLLGTYYIKTNQGGGGDHVCNCGYMVAPEARGRGLATTMCRHSQARALELGFDAMQFNFVVATNEAAVRLWQKLGFDVVGRLPRAFRHPDGRLVDALVMYKWLRET